MENCIEFTLMNGEKVVYPRICIKSVKEIRGEVHVQVEGLSTFIIVLNPSYQEILRFLSASR